MDSAIIHTHLKADKPCLIPKDAFYLDPAGVENRKWMCDKIIRRKATTSHWEARCNFSFHTSPNSVILTKLIFQLPFQTGLLISTMYLINLHTMKLHMATVVKTKNKKEKKKKLSVCKKAVKYWNIYLIAQRPVPHTNPATHTDIGENVLLIHLCQFIQHKVNSWVNILDVIMLSSSKVHTEVNSKYSY